MKRFFCLAMAILSLVLLVVPAITATTNASTQQIYAGESYFTYNVGGKLTQRKKGTDKEIQSIPKNSLLYVYGTYKLNTTWNQYGSRSYVQYAGDDGHVLDTGFGKKFLFHKRNYHKSVVNCDVPLKDDDGKTVATIPKGTEIEVYGVSTANNKESVVRYAKKHLGRIANNCIGNNIPQENINAGGNSASDKQTLSDFKLKSDNMFVAMTTANLLSFQNTSGIEIAEIPKNSMIIIYGVWAGNSARYVAYWEDGYGTVNSNYIEKLYDIPKGFSFTSDVYWGITDYALDMWNKDDVNTKKEIPKGALVLVLGQYNSKRAVVIYKNSCVTVTKKYITPTKKSIVTIISQQKVLLLKDGKIEYRMYCVTGKTGHSTRIGTFKVSYKDRDTSLKGTNNGVRYELPVKYWVPFDGDIGFHDNYTRINFGGNIYINNGSLGCVNLSLKDAEILYNFTYTGMRVDVIA